MRSQSYDRAKSRSRYGNPILSNKTYRNSVISFPPTFRMILDKGGTSRKRRGGGGSEINHLMLSSRNASLISVPKKGLAYLVSGTTSPSSTQAILVTAAPMFTTQAVDIPAPYVVAKDSY